MKSVTARRWSAAVLFALVALSSMFGYSRLALAQAIVGQEVTDAQQVDQNAANLSKAGCSTNSGWTLDAQSLTKVTDAVLSPFNDADSIITSKASEYAGTVMPNALTLGGILASSYIMWSILRYLADSSGNYVAFVVDSMIPVIMVSGVLSNYSGIITGFQNLFKSMIPASGGLSQQIAKMGAGFFNGLSTGVAAIWNSLSCSGDAGFAVLMHALLTGLLLLFAGVLAVFAIAEIVGVLFTGSILTGVAIAVGPYFIAAGVSPWSAEYMKKWIGFLMSALFYKSLISILLYLVNGVIDSVVTTVQNFNGASGFPIGNAIALVGIMWVMKHVFQSIPGIAAALLGATGGKAPSLNKAAESTMKTAGAASRAYKSYQESKQKAAAAEAAKKAGGTPGAPGATPGPSAAGAGPSFNPGSPPGGSSAAGNGAFGTSPVSGMRWAQGAGSGGFNAAAGGSACSGSYAPNYGGGNGAGSSAGGSAAAAQGGGGAAAGGTAQGGQSTPGFAQSSSGDVTDVAFTEVGGGQGGAQGGTHGGTQGGTPGAAGAGHAGSGGFEVV